jgi:hypothetical protein
MGLRELKSKIKALKTDELVSLIAQLYKLNKTNKDYLDFWLKPNEQELYDKYHSIIVECFYPRHGNKLKLTEAKKAISDFKKFNASHLLTADLMLVYVENATSYAYEYDYFGEKLFSSAINVLFDFLRYIDKHDLLEDFRKRCENISDIAYYTYEFYYEEMLDLLIIFFPNFLEAESEIQADKTRKAKIINFPKL